MGSLALGQIGVSKGLAGGPVGSLFGANGGAGGTGFAGPTGAPIVNPTDPNQIGGAYTGTQNAMGSQNALLDALQKQQGLQNQSQVYGQLQGIVNGTGPNPAQAQLAQATGANVANQAALMAGQRGAAANVGLIARQAGQQGSQIQQNAAGQAATLQAQQSLNALSAAGQLANTQAGQQIGQTNANTQAQQAEQGQIFGAQQGYNNNLTGMQSNINTANAGLADTQLKGQQQIFGGIGQALGQSAGMLAEGGQVGAPVYSGGPQSEFGQFLSRAASNIDQPTDQPQAASAPSQALQKGASKATSGLLSALSGKSVAMAQGGTVPALVSPGEVYLSPEQVEMVRQGADPMHVGERIPGKPAVGGAKNSYANDFVKKDLKEGGIVVPRSETKSKNPDQNSAQFVANVLAKRKARG